MTYDPFTTYDCFLQFKPFAFLLVRDGQFVTAFGATASQHLTAVGGGHPLAEAVLIFPLPVRWLIRSFHDLCALKPLFSNESAKIGEPREFAKLSFENWPLYQALLNQ